MSTTDCEKFEPLLLDELYEELDEVTSAALKRHVAGCARCKASLDGMRATRRLVSLPMVDPPEGLEERIFAAAKEAQNVVPIKSRFSRALSVAGTWAMRPQTAMAAVFLLMIGSSAFLFRDKMKRDAGEAQVSVTVAGSPQAVATAVAENDAVDDKSAAAAHGPITAPPAVATAAPSASGALALADQDGDGTLDRLTGAAREKNKDEANVLGAITTDSVKAEEAKKSASRSALAGNDYAPRNAGVPGGAALGDPYSVQQAPAPPPAAKRGGPADAQDPFTLGMAAYRARNFAEATRQLDAAARTGDQNAALWAARATKEGQGCATALGRFDAVAQRAAGTWHGSEASLEAARCQIAMGQLDPARTRLNQLAQVPTHAQPAKQALAELDQIAARQKGGHSSGGSHASPKAAAAPAERAPSKPAATAADALESGF